jgi:hypothetical protein
MRGQALVEGVSETRAASVARRHARANVGARVMVSNPSRSFEVESERTKRGVRVFEGHRRNHDAPGMEQTLITT